MKYFYCFGEDLANYLLNRGFIYGKLKPNPKHPCYENIWLFEDTPELQAVVAEFYETRKSGKIV